MNRVIALLLPTLLLLSGCNQIDPYTRDGTWRPTGANEANLRAMVAVPADLVTATPASPADGTLAAAALNRLRHDLVRPLPDSGAAQFVTVSSGSQAAPAAAPPTSGNSN